MGIISVEKAGNLYWLGRYSERVFTTLKTFYTYYDRFLDMGPDAFLDLCNKLGIENTYDDKEDFIYQYLYNREDSNSICASINRAFDNAVVVRDEIGSETLAYIQMALDTMKKSKESNERFLQHQKVLDYIFAFWGCADDMIDEEESRNIMKVGKYIERMDLYMRLSYQYPHLERTFTKLKSKLRKLNFPYHDEELEELERILNKKEDWKEDYDLALGSLCSIIDIA